MKNLDSIQQLPKQGIEPVIWLGLVCNLRPWSFVCDLCHHEIRGWWWWWWSSSHQDRQWCSTI